MRPASTHSYFTVVLYCRQSLAGLEGPAIQRRGVAAEPCAGASCCWPRPAAPTGSADTGAEFFRSRAEFSAP